MKKLILSLLLIVGLLMSAQRKTVQTTKVVKNKPKVGINVRGVELTYNKAKKTMTLIAKREVMRTNDDDMYTVIKISKNAELQIIINGETLPSDESYFTLTGHILESFWMFNSRRRCYCDGDFYPATGINKYVFYHINPGEEYILSVSNLCDDKYQTNYKSASLITN